MATVAAPEISPLQRERSFFFYMALVFLATAVAGFGFFFAIGASSFASPWWVHAHALTMCGWLAFYVSQTWLVYRGDLVTHRRFGVYGAVASVWVIGFSGWAITQTIAQGRYPPFFTPNFFLAMDWLNFVIFAALLASAIRLRTRPDWHKRLMFGAMLSLLSVAWGRLILPQFFDQRAIVIVLVILLFHVGAAMLFDRRVHGRVHPAHYWTAGALVAWVGTLFAIADLPPVVAYAEALAG